MIIETVKFAKEFSVLGSSEWVTIGGTLEPGEDPIEEVIKLKQKMISMYGVQYKKADEGSYDGNGTVFLGDEYGPAGKWNTEPRKPLVINRAYERMEVLIGNCTTLEQLSEHKEFVNKNPDLMTAYSNKLKELTKNITA